MRRRPGIAALENVVRGVVGQPQLAPKLTIYPAAIPSTLTIWPPVVSVGEVKHARGRSRVSGGGNVHAAGYATHGRPDRLAEVSWHVAIFTGTGWLGEQVTGTADGALGFALVGVIGAHLMWERWAHPRG